MDYSILCLELEMEECVEELGILECRMDFYGSNRRREMRKHALKLRIRDLEKSISILNEYKHTIEFMAD